MRLTRALLVCGAGLLILPLPAAAQSDLALGEAMTSIVEIRQAGGLDPSTLSLIDDAVRAVRADSTVLHRVTLRMLRITRGGEVVQEAPQGFGYPMLTMSLDPDTRIVPDDLRASLSGGDAVMGEITARVRGARVGDVVHLEGPDGRVVPVRLGAILPDQDLRWSEIVIGTSFVPGLEIDRPYAVVAWGTGGIPLAAAIRIWTTHPSVRVLDGSQETASDLVLPIAMVKEQFGEFAVAPAEGDSVLVDREWRDTWIVTVDFPIVGETRCHRTVVPYIRAALAEVGSSGLAAELDRADFQAAGGCFNPRFNRGADPGYSLSRHSWGIAVDFNPTTNRYGDDPALSAEIVNIFRRWGFSWGGAWSVPDGMHFEWFSQPSNYPVACSDFTAIPREVGTPGDGDPGGSSSWMLLPVPGSCQ